MSNYIRDKLITLWETHYSPSLSIIGWLLVRATSQALVTIIIARYLGAHDYGNFVALIALASFFSPLAGLGLHGVILINGARTPDHIHLLIGSCLVIWSRSTCVVSIIGISVAYLALPQPIPPSYSAVLIFAEISSSSFIELVARLEQSQRRNGRFGALLAGLPSSRLVALFALIITDCIALQNWVWAYSAASFFYCACIFVWLLRTRHISPSPYIQWDLIKTGLPFSIGALATRIQGEFNKPVLAQMSYAATGNFNIAQRVLDLIALPLMALQENFWPHFYANSNSFRQMLIGSAGIIFSACIVGVLIIISAPMIPTLLGPDFAEANVIIIWLAWLPLVQTVRNLLNAMLISYEKKGLLIAIYIVSATIGISLNLWLILWLGLKGAIYAAYLSEAATISILLFFIFFKGKVLRHD